MVLKIEIKDRLRKALGAGLGTTAVDYITSLETEITTAYSRAIEAEKANKILLAENIKLRQNLEIARAELSVVG